MINRVVLMVIDGFGVGEAPDAKQYGDEGSNTLVNIYNQVHPNLPNMKNLGLYNIDGIECYHSIFTLEENEKILKFAKEHKLLISGGSDYHGDNKPNISLGIGKGNLNIPDEIIGNFKFIKQNDGN